MWDNCETGDESHPGLNLSPPVRVQRVEGGHVTAEDLHPVPLHKRGGSGEGYMLCDDCGVLAELPSDITLN
jgi:hypothetical protein